VHTQINVSTPEEVLFFGTAAAAQNRGKCANTPRAPDGSKVPGKASQ
jgi:hypothetical protein